MKDLDRTLSLELSSFASAEAQAAAIADDVAYNSHDIDDGLRAGLFTLEQVCAGVPLAQTLRREIAARHPGLDEGRIIHELVRRIITLFVEDVLAESARRLEEVGPQTVDDVRAADRPMLAFSSAFKSADADIKRFLFPAMYRHPQVMSVRDKAAHVIGRLFPRFFEDVRTLPLEWAALAMSASDSAGQAA